MTFTSRTLCLSVLAASMGLSAPARAQVAGPYTPEQVYFVLFDAMRQALGFTPTIDPGQSTWFSLSTVGSVVTVDDPAHVNTLANFCPEAKPVLDAFSREPKLDAVYESINDNAVTPVRKYSAAYHKARKVLFDQDGVPTAQLLAYRKYQDAYVKTWTAYSQATDSASRNVAAIAMSNAMVDWRGAGHRATIDEARNISEREEAVAGGTRRTRRSDMLEHYRNAGLRGTDILGAFTAPASSFSPSPSTWATAPGWVKVDFDSEQTMSRYNHDESQRSGFGGLSLGFVHIGGSAGGTQTTETRVNKVYKLTYQFEIMKATINRPWLDSTLLFQPLDWTWKKNPATTVYPHVASGRDPSGRPLPTASAIYDNKAINCALLPVEAVIARNRKIVATVATSDYESFIKSGSAQGGGSLFGIFGGGGKQSWTTTVINQDAVNTTFSVEAAGIAVIGFVSQIVPQSPNPNLSDKWPAQAWLPKAGVVPVGGQ